MPRPREADRTEVKRAADHRYIDGVVGFPFVWRLEEPRMRQETRRIETVTFFSGPVEEGGNGLIGKIESLFVVFPKLGEFLCTYLWHSGFSNNDQSIR